MKTKKIIRNLLKDQSGEFGVKQIAITVAVIVIIGFIIVIVQNNLDGWIGEIWDLFMEQIENLIS
ncbi:hypothetical protein RBH29_04510 [Herbivorax sp. ANBcel31]|uniref:hypothetical protein n=1 Tax=Herbivorax sp. ANBcel31 TaxID=3069754 RepID=UPI0027B6AF74|nr:hypothetical protein [Herbivorax sp. ANBcel31]MDQ2085696.1 hypothetical protein [Herbivorax sp. ANBcel31]